MVEFIKAYPDIIVWLFGVLLAVIGGFASALLVLVKMALDRLTLAISELEKSLTVAGGEISILKDRLQRIETTCEMQRANCPMGHGQQNPRITDRLSARNA